jgi:nitrogen fixation-related uncharacterized protein
MNDAIVMILTVSGGFALLAVLAAVWWFASGQYETRREGAALPLDDDEDPTSPAMPAPPGR